MGREHLGLFLALSLLVGCASSVNNRSPLDVLFPYQQLNNIDLVDFREPSGLVFHPLRNSLFVIGDEGHIAEFLPDGTIIKQGRVDKKDYEGITVNPATGMLYVVMESKAKIVEVNPDTFGVTREISIDPTFDNKTILAAEKNHTEAITFVSGPNNSGGGTFFLVRQNTNFNGAEISIVFEVEASLGSGAAKKQTARITNVFQLNFPDLSGLYYNPINDTLFVISDQTNTFFEVTKSGQVLEAYALPGDNQEGITLDSAGFLYIAQDSGGILRFAPRKTKGQ